METIDTTAKDITPVQPLAPVVFDPDRDVKNAQSAAKALMTVIAASKPLEMNGKKYLYFEHWQTVAQFFGNSAGIDSTEELKDEKGHFCGFSAKAVVYNAQGVIVGSAEAMCLTEEKNWTDKPKFQLKSMAQTRAMAKALRSKFGSIAVLAGAEATPAEEMTTETVARATLAPKADRPKPTQVRIGNEDRAPSEAQLKMIRGLMEQKGYKVDDIIDWGFQPVEKITRGPASELIDKLMKAPSKLTPEGNELPTIDEEARNYT